MASSAGAATTVHNPSRSAVTVRVAAKASPFNASRGSAAFCSGLRKVDGIGRLGMKRSATGQDDSSNTLLTTVAGTGQRSSNSNFLLDSQPAEVCRTPSIKITKKVKICPAC